MRNLTNPAFAGNALGMPLVVAEAPINNHYQWRLELNAVGDSRTFDLRRWHTPSDGEPRPTSKGLMLPIKHLPAIAAAFAEAADMVDPGEP
jgi:hypothetical protein